MDHFSEIDNLTKITRRREFDDGLQDFVLGVTFLFIGLAGGFFFSISGLEWFVRGLVWNRELTIIATLTLIPLYVLLAFGARRLIDRFRRVTLWKDQGYIKPLRWQVSWQTNLLAAVVLIGMLATAYWLNLNGAVSQAVVLRTLVAAAGVATGIVLFSVGRELRIRRYQWIGPISCMLSALLIPLPLSFAAAWLALGVSWMVLLSISGAWTLRSTMQSLEARSRE